jgi:NADH-quinone oxidoreductase subunit L
MLETILNHISLQGLIWLILLAPLVTSAINWCLNISSCRFGWKNNGSFVSLFGILGPLVSFLSAGVVFWILTGLEGSEPAAITGPLFNWITFSGWIVELGLKVDQLSMIMALVVTGVGSLIHIYSIGYMDGDDGYARYFAELNLFLFFMLLLVLADNLLLMFVGWEGVGLCSYLLIGYWFDDPAKAAAGKKAFIVNRIGDFAFMIGIFFIWKGLANQEIVGPNALNFEVIERNTAFLLPAATTICIALFIGACGKSAQIPLYVWLPDAMAGPTPVSALIHAATMVTAGVYMVARLNFLYILSPIAMQMIAYIGAATALFAALIGLAQNDIKKVLAYSTISQLGYMFVAEGVGAFGAGIFHLVTHAFFKAALFLGAGSVIHALHGEQNLFKMGGLKKYLPGTFWVFFVAALAISGVWPFSGFFSKDEILWQLYNRGHIGLWLIGFITAGITSFYIFRLVALTFFGKTNIPEEKRGRIHESKISMLIPLVLLGVLSLAGGWMKGAFGYFLEAKFAAAAFDTEGPHKNIEHILAVISVLWAVHWAFVAWVIYVQKPDWPRAVATKFNKIYTLLMNKFYIDELYNLIIVRPIKWISINVLWKGLDISLIDNVCVDGAPRSVGLIGKVVQVAQTGMVPHYIFFIVIGLSAMIVWLVL